MKINLLSLCESEMLTLLITKENFNPKVLDWKQESRIKYYLNEYPTELKLNLAAAKFWIRFLGK